MEGVSAAKAVMVVAKRGTGHNRCSQGRLRRLKPTPMRPRCTSLRMEPMVALEVRQGEVEEAKEVGRAARAGGRPAAVESGEAIGAANREAEDLVEEVAGTVGDTMAERQVVVPGVVAPSAAGALVVEARGSAVGVDSRGTVATAAEAMQAESWAEALVVAWMAAAGKGVAMMALAT